MFANRSIYNKGKDEEKKSYSGNLPSTMDIWRFLLS
jgi:hypothetical protein